MNVAEDGDGGRCLSARSGRRGKVPQSAETGKVEGASSRRELDVVGEGDGPWSGTRAKC